LEGLLQILEAKLQVTDVQSFALAAVLFCEDCSLCKSCGVGRRIAEKFIDLNTPAASTNAGVPSVGKQLRLNPE